MSATVTKHHKKIGDITYEVNILTASEGLVIFPKLVALFGTPLLKLVLGTSEKERKEAFSNSDVMAAALNNLATNAAENDGLLVLRDLMKGVAADKVRISEEAIVAGSVSDNFDTHFAGNYMHLFEVAFWVAQVNFTKS